MSIIREEISKPLIVNTGKFTGRSSAGVKLTLVVFLVPTKLF